MKRRHYAILAGSVCVSGTAGCISDGTPDQPDTTENAEFGIDGVRDGSTTIELSNSDRPNAWTQIGYDGRNSNYARGVTGPADDGHIEWTALGERSLYPPVADEHLYLTENWTDGAAISIDSRDGSVRWRNSSLPPMRWVPALHGDTMFCITRTSNNEVSLHALDVESGDAQWSREITASSSVSPATGPTVTDETVFIGSNTGVLAIDAATGESLWNSTLRDHTIDIEEGPKWRTDWATPAVTDDLVFTFDLNDSYEEPRKVYALDRERGDVEWVARIELDGWHLEGHIVAATDHVFVLAVDPHIVNHTDDSADERWEGAQRLYVLDSTDGSVDRHWELSGKTMGQPAYAEGVLFVDEWYRGAGTGRLHAIDVASNSICWTHETSAGRIGTPAVTPERVYVTQGQEVAAVAVGDGSVLWRVPVGEPISHPVISDDSIYVLTSPTRDSDSELIAIRNSSA